MKNELTEVERLDIAARLLVTENYISGMRVGLVCLSFSVVAGALDTKGSMHLVLAARVMAALFALISLSFWLNYRYKPYFLAILPVVGITGFMLRNGFQGHWPIWIAISTTTLLLIYRTWNGASLSEVANSAEWKSERLQVEEWLRILQRHDRRIDVFEFDGGSFWVGYHNLPDHENGAVLGPGKVYEV